MAFTVERLRAGLLVGAGLLVLVVVAFLGYAEFRAHRFVHGLPGRLGIDVRQETNAFTYSQTVKGQTIFTIHASKAVQHKDNKVTLHDVGIVLYGSGGNRADRIYGDEFEYDQTSGVMRAVGEVQIDLAAPAAADAKGKMDYAAGKEPSVPAKTQRQAGAARLIHVKTRGLVFSQKEGRAETQEGIEFSTGGLTGHAKGADYSSETGILVLESTVEAAGLQGGQPVILTASHAELDRDSELATLTHAKYVTLASRPGGRTAEAERVKVHLRSDGTAERVEGDGGVRLRDEAGAEVTAARGEVALSEESRPRLASLRGGVTLVDQEALRQAHGGAGEGVATFDTEGRLQQVVMHGAVHVDERVRAGVDVGWSERQIAGETVDLAMAPVGAPIGAPVGAGAEGPGSTLAAASGGKKGPAERTVLREVKATGAAQMMMMNAASKDKKGTAKGGGSSSVAGDMLTADFAEVEGRSELRTVEGKGHTVLRRVNPLGAEDVSSGESLHAEFRGMEGNATKDTGRGKAKVPGGAGERVGMGVELVSAVQQGGVKITHRSAADAKTGAVAEEDAAARSAAYDAATDAMTLAGSVQVSDATSVLWAETVVARRGSGDATATGGVKVSYLQGGEGSKPGNKPEAGEPVHVVAARAEMVKATGVGTFYGDGGGAGGAKKARLWQGASQVEAPELVFEQKTRKVTAKGLDEAQAKEVRAVFVGAAAEGKKASVVRVQSRVMTFVDETHRANFSGGVLVESADGTMRGQEAQVFLSAGNAGCGGGTGLGTGQGKGQGRATGTAGALPCNAVGGGAASAGTERAKGTGTGKSSAKAGGETLFGGSVERVEATGEIVMEQPGRKATGAKVVYTAADGMFVLTGAPGAPPKVVDASRGTLTGDTLRLHAGDNSVVVLSDSKGHQRVDTDTQIKH